MTKHKGPVCKGCSEEFYYDFTERNDGSGYCWICFDDRAFGLRRAAAVQPSPQENASE